MREKSHIFWHFGKQTPGINRQPVRHDHIFCLLCHFFVGGLSMSLGADLLECVKRTQVFQCKSRESNLDGVSRVRPYPIIETNSCFASLRVSHDKKSRLGFRRSVSLHELICIRTHPALEGKGQKPSVRVFGA